MLNKNKDNLTISQNQATVNPVPSTIAPQTCPTCHGRGVARINTGLPGKPHYADCGGCGGSGEVEDGIAPVVEGGYDIYVEGIYFWAITEAEAARIYNEEHLGLTVRKRSSAGVFQGQERLRQWKAEFEEIEIPF